MSAIDASTPSRSARVVRVEEALTAEKATSSPYSDGEASPFPRTSASGSEGTATTPALYKALVLPVHATFARLTAFAPAAAHTPSQQYRRSGSRAVITPEQPLTTACSPAPLSTPSPVRTILDYYLGVSPSPRRPSDRDGGSSVATAQARADRGEAAEQEGRSDSSTASSTPDTFRRSPAPARAFLDEFLAVNDDDDSGAAYEEPGDTRPGTHGLLSHTATPSRLIGVAMDNSPVVQQMWEETSSSALSSGSHVSRASSPSSSVVVLPQNHQMEATSAPGTKLLRDEVRSAHRSSQVNAAQETASVLTDNSVQRTPTAPARAAPQLPPEPAAVVKETGRSTPAPRPQAVERELVYPKLSAKERSGDAGQQPAPSLFVPSFRPWKATDAHGPPSTPAFVANSTLTKGGHRSSEASARRAEDPPHKDPPWEEQPVKADTLPQRNPPAPNALLRSAPNGLQRFRLEKADGAQAASSETLLQKLSIVLQPAVSHLASDSAHAYELSVSNTAAATLHTPSQQQRRRRCFSRLNSREQVHTRSVYRDAASISGESAAGPAEPRRSAEASAGARWTISRKIRYHPVTESIELTEEGKGTENSICRNRERTRSNARSRSASNPCRRAGSVPPAPLHTRTSLLRLEATSARKTAEAAREEEEEHPTFRPSLAPRSARICQAKRRELEAAEAAATRADQPANTTETATAVPCAMERQEIRLPVSKHRPFPVATTVRSNGAYDRLYAEAATQRARRDQLHVARTADENEPAPQHLPPQPRRRSSDKSPRQQQQFAVLTVEERRSPECAPGKPALKPGSTARKPQPLLNSSLSPVSDLTRESATPPSVSLSPLRAESSVPRADLYSVDDIAREPRQQRVEDRLLALEEDRRRRLYLMRRIADTRDAISGQPFFAPFTGR